MSDQIRAILQTYGEDARSATWKVQNSTVIYHAALERIAIKAGIWFDRPDVLRAERDEAVILVTGHLGDDATAWSMGEALVNVNYRVSGRQAAYVYAMAEKRAKDRVILKLIGLHGLVYSEEEADEFKGRPEPDAQPEPERDQVSPFDKAKQYLMGANLPDKLRTRWQQTEPRLGEFAKAEADELRSIYRNRLEELTSLEVVA